MSFPLRSRSRPSCLFKTLMVKFGSYKDCDLARSAANIPNHQKEELSDQNKRATALLKRLYEQNVPGVILADAVGKGKTYVALGVAFAVLAEKRRGRVLVLTHSRHMAKTWQRRWSEEMKEKVSQQWRECVAHR